MGHPHGACPSALAADVHEAFRAALRGLGHDHELSEAVAGLREGRHKATRQTATGPRVARAQVVHAHDAGLAALAADLHKAQRRACRRSRHDRQAAEDLTGLRTAWTRPGGMTYVTGHYQTLLGVPDWKSLRTRCQIWRQL